MCVCARLCGWGSITLAGPGGVPGAAEGRGCCRGIPKGDAPSLTAPLSATERGSFLDWLHPSAQPAHCAHSLRSRDRLSETDAVNGLLFSDERRASAKFPYLNNMRFFLYRFCQILLWTRPSKIEWDTPDNLENPAKRLSVLSS